MKILYLNKSFVVISKPVGIGAQPDLTGGADALSLTKDILRAQGEADSLWLIHRLDRVVGGILIFARTKNAAAKLSELCGGGGLKKEYLAIAEGSVGKGEYTDLLIKDSQKGRAYVVDRMRGGVKEAKLKYESISNISTDNGERTLTKIELITGRFHQIRCQFSHRGTPLVGDGKYGSRDFKTRFPALFAYRLSFEYENKKYSFNALPDVESYPWSLFEKTVYEKECSV